MEILGFEPKDINILTAEEIESKAKEFFDKKKKSLKPKSYELTSLRESYARLQLEPMPYKLFRFNEICDFNLNYIGVEITETEFYERLGVLPPIPFEYDIYEGAIVPECITENRYEHIFCHNGKHYCVIMPAKNKRVVYGQIIGG
jgi:hypothetical protein